MNYGLMCYYKNQFLNSDNFFKIINLLRNYNITLELFNIIEKKTGKTKKIKNYEKALNDKQYSSIIASSGKNKKNALSATIHSDNNYFLPYNFNIEIEFNSNEKAFILFDNIIKILKPIYSYCAYNADYNYLCEELTFTPISNGWLTGEINEERETFLLNLQRKRKDIGKIIPQIYPLNYFLTTDTLGLINNLKSILGNDWLFEELNGITKVKYNKSLDWKKFEELRNNIELD